MVSRTLVWKAAAASIVAAFATFSPVTAQAAKGDSFSSRDQVAEQVTRVEAAA